jgi:hypothetical protein
MPLKTTVNTIVPDNDTCYLIGPEGLVWEQPTLGEPVILAARNEAERAAVVAHINDLLNMGLVPYGMPLNQRVNVALFGGTPIRDCHWVRWMDAPAPTGDAGDDLPETTVVIALPEPQRVMALDDLMTITEAARLLGTTTQAINESSVKSPLWPAVRTYDDLASDPCYRIVGPSYVGGHGTVMDAIPLTPDRPPYRNWLGGERFYR